MPSQLAWLDHDQAARDRSIRILAHLQERDTRDELGVGSIRDGLAEILFPGTSTIQTRLRYFLFVPWIYRALERGSLSPKDFSRRAIDREKALIEPLKESEGMNQGVIGFSSGHHLVRFPASIYWAGLGKWGIRRFAGSQDDYFRSLSRIRTREGSRRRMDDSDLLEDSPATAWHPGLPAMPEGFPEGMSFALTREEAVFIRGCLEHHCSGSLLRDLANREPALAVEFPWWHPGIAHFSSNHRELLDQARRFSAASFGAAVIYNLALAERRGSDELVEARRGMWVDWWRSTDTQDLLRWDVAGLWAALDSHGVGISPRTMSFIEGWLEVVKAQGDRTVDSKHARNLIRAREMHLKGPRSRFINPKSLEQWSGSAGLVKINLRWNRVQQLLLDLHNGLRS